jgi:hypothetical protein
MLVQVKFAEFLPLALTLFYFAELARRTGGVVACVEAV